MNFNKYGYGVSEPTFKKDDKKLNTAEISLSICNSQIAIGKKASRMIRRRKALEISPV